MKQLIKLIFFAAILMGLCIPTVSAFTVDNYVCEPSGALTTNTPVTVSYTIGFTSTSDTTFPGGSDLVMTTDLTNPKWAYSLILDGVENTRSPISGKTLDLSGFEVSYPSSVTEKIRVTLTGTAPTVDTSTSKVILDVYEVNSAGNKVTSNQLTKTAFVNSASQTTSPTTVASTVKTTVPTAVPTTIQVSAFTVESYTCNPSGSLTPNTPVTVSYAIGFASASGTTFPPGSDLVMTTDLTNPKWAYSLILDGVENTRSPVSGKTIELSGFEVSYPSSVTEKMRVTLTGTAPTVDTSISKVILDVYEVNSAGNKVTSTQLTKTAFVNSASQTTSPTTVVSTVKTTVPTAVPTTVKTTTPTITTTTKSVSQLLEEQNAKIEEQNKLIAEQNAKMAQQNGLLDQIIAMFKGLFGM